MAVIVPIVKPLVEVVRQLAVALNEARAYLGQPPVDVDAMIEAAFAAPGGVVVPPVATPQPAAPVAQVENPQPSAAPKPQAPEVVAEEPAAPESADVPADGCFYFSGVDSNADGNIFDEIDDTEGYFKVQVQNGVASFAFTQDIDKQQELIDSSNFLFDYIAEYTTMPTKAPITVVTPGKAMYKNGAWVIEKNIKLM